MKNLLLINFCLLLVNFSWGQNNRSKQLAAHATLSDDSTKTLFILDTSQVFIIALDSMGRQLWRTDPWKDNHIEMYRIQRPVIVKFFFANNEWTNNKEAIWIVYNNTQFGIVEKANGKFTWFGQD
jgi:hypothetical protein